ncbi:MAG: hypothetical protein M9916_11075 [Crocinitomicaceae bacterium]|nr:hypothetical protein [Crocinitomicaceae bacterium]
MKFVKSNWFRMPFNILLYGFAAYGFFLVMTYLAMKFQWTKESGMVDKNNRYFQSMHDKYNQGFKVDSISVAKRRHEIMNRIILLNDYYPTNAEYILAVYDQSKDDKLALQMLDAVEIRLQNNASYLKDKKILNDKLKTTDHTTGLSAFEWMNIQEWKYFKEALIKDKKWIDSAANVSGVSSRLIVSCLVGEQVRLFNSRRERFKEYIAPLKTLALETNLSYGVTGIKESTAIKIEDNLKNKLSPYYLGEEYENLLDYDSLSVYSNNLNDTMHVRLQRLVQFSNHYYSYLYAALFVRQIKMQWERAGFPIHDRPEILASLFNLGYHKSKPKKDPQAGGSVFLINENEYTFGSVAFEFYYSGELAEEFPYYNQLFDWNKEKKMMAKNE